MSLEQLSYFVAVAEEANLGRAARRLHICQPPLSRQIKSLESELGTVLFDRTPHGMALRPSGRRFLMHARRILAEVERARQDVAELGDRPQRTGAGDSGLAPSQRVR